MYHSYPTHGPFRLHAVIMKLHYCQAHTPIFQPGTTCLDSSSPPPTPSSPPIPPNRDRQRRRRNSGSDTQAHSGPHQTRPKPHLATPVHHLATAGHSSSKRGNLPSRLLRRIARSASSVGGGGRGGSTHAQFGMINVVVVKGAADSSSVGSGKVFGLDLIAHLRATGREREELVPNTRTRSRPPPYSYSSKLFLSVIHITIQYSFYSNILIVSSCVDFKRPV